MTLSGPTLAFSRYIEFWPETLSVNSPSVIDTNRLATKRRCVSNLLAGPDLVYRGLVGSGRGQVEPGPAPQRASAPAVDTFRVGGPERCVHQPNVVEKGYLRSMLRSSGDSGNYVLRLRLSASLVQSIAR